MKNLLRVLFPLLIAIVIPLSQTGCGASTPAEHIAKARELIEKGQPREATIELTNALQQDPNLVEARTMLAEVSVQLGDGARGEKEIRKAIELGLAPPSAQLLLVKAIALQGEPQRVLAETQLIAEGVSNSDRAAILGMRGHAHAERHEFEEAVDDLDEALHVDAKSVPALVGMALMKALQRDYDAAREWTSKAIAADASSAEPWSLLGQMELELGDPEKAESDLTKAIDLRGYPNIDLAKRVIALALLDKFPEADRDIATLKNSGFKDDSYVNYAAGVNFFRQQKYRDAVDAFEISKRNSPPYFPREYFLAAAYMYLGNFEMARQSAVMVNTLVPQSTSAKRLLGAVQINQRELDAATKVLSEALRNAPEDTVILNMLGYVALQNGDAAQAVGYYERALVLQPDSTQTANSLAIARLIAGQAPGASGETQPRQDMAEGKNFTQEFVSALTLLRDNKIDDALQRAEALRAKYPESVEPLKLLAACHLLRRQWDTARTYLEQALRLKPNELSAARNLAILDIQAGNMEGAKKLLRGAVEEHPEAEDAVLILSGVETELEGEDAGIRVLEQANTRYPAGLNVQEALARKYFAAKRYERVLEVTRDLTDKQFQQLPALMELRAAAQLQTGDSASAQLLYKKWVQMEPDSARVHYLLGDSLARGGDFDSAKREFARSLELDAGYLPARVGEIKLLVHGNERAKAVGRLAELRKEFGERREVLNIEGWYALSAGDFATAAARYSTLLENQQDSELMTLYVSSLLAQAKSDEAIASMQRWLEKQPRDLAIMMQLAGAYMSLKREDDARAAYAKVIESYPDNVPALNNLAWLNRESNLEAGISYAQRADELSPNDPSVMDTFGTLLVRRGDRERGQRMIQKAAKLAPNDLEIQLHFAQILAERGDTAEARQLFNHIIEKGEGNPAAASAKSALDSLP